MSVDTCTAFLEHAQEDPQLGALLRAITDPGELVVLGQRRGYSFDIQDLVSASSAQPGETAAATTAFPAAGGSGAGGETTVGHYELEFAAVPQLRPLVDELPNLTIQPAGVDLERFAAASRLDDLAWTSMSPAAAGFHERYEEVMSDHWRGDSEGASRRRDFHLVNLDQHVHDPLYHGYFEAKARVIGCLEGLFGCEIRLSGSMWYPPFAYRLWHTNETQPGWRMYLIDFDEEVAESDERSFFRYMNPSSKELVTLRDRPKMLRFFKVEQHPDRLLWHCIVNGAQRNRWSFGFAVPDDWMDRLGASIPLDALLGDRGA